MARYTGPTDKIARRFREPIFGPTKALSGSEVFPPGQHGRNRRRKVKEYGTQLNEKQKVKYMYGVLERQFRKTFERAQRRHGITGENLIKLLESRLDNVVYRMGCANTRNGARQLVLHKHITVNGKVVNIPSFNVRPGDVVGVREKSKSLEVVVNALAARGGRRYPWIDWNNENMTAVYISEPDRTQITENINEQLIVELYSK